MVTQLKSSSSNNSQWFAKWFCPLFLVKIFYLGHVSFVYSFYFGIMLFFNGKPCNYIGMSKD